MCRCMSKTNQVDVYENNLGLVHVKLNKKNYFYENNERGNIVLVHYFVKIFFYSVLHEPALRPRLDFRIFDPFFKRR